LRFREREAPAEQTGQRPIRSPSLGCSAAEAQDEALPRPPRHRFTSAQRAKGATVRITGSRTVRPLALDVIFGETQTRAIALLQPGLLERLARWAAWGGERLTENRERNPGGGPRNRHGKRVHPSTKPRRPTRAHPRRNQAEQTGQRPRRSPSLGCSAAEAQDETPSRPTRANLHAPNGPRA
jgi:hypothetical protein